MSAGLKYSKRDFTGLVDGLVLEDCESLVNSLAQRLYRHGRAFVPLYPWVFVRALPREQQVGKIYLPEHDQNKVVHEGIVLATWHEIPERAAWQETKTSKELPKHHKPGVIKSQLKVGDHVLFPHWAGAPVNGYNDSYKVVMEIDWDMSRHGGILAVVEYDEDTIRKQLVDLLVASEAEPSFFDVADNILEKFQLVDRDKKSVTLSGR